MTFVIKFVAGERVSEGIYFSGINLSKPFSLISIYEIHTHTESKKCIVIIIILYVDIYIIRWMIYNDLHRCSRAL